MDEGSKIKYSTIPNFTSEIVYSSDSDCEYRIVKTITKIKNNSTGATFNCNFCHIFFRRFESHDAHIRRYHPDKVNIICEVVSGNDEVPNNTTTIISEESANTLVEVCALCNESYLTEEIEKHCKTCPALSNISTSIPLRSYCNTCGKMYNITTIEDHVKNCSITLENYDDEGEIDNDYIVDDDNTDNDNGEQFIECKDVILENETTVVQLSDDAILTEECHKCGDMYPSNRVEEHLKVCTSSVDSNDDNIRIGLDTTMERCHKCNEIYVVAEIEQHVKECKETQNVSFDITSLCPVCGKIFKTHKLKSHMKIHGEKTFLCTICGKGCISGTSLKIHLQTHTKNYRHQCDLCQKKFSTRHTLKEHIRIHSGVKEYSCKICSKSFTQQNGLKQHMVHCHTGVKKVACDYCAKRFHKNSDLKEHLKVHTKERSYACEVCGAQFIHGGSLRKHLKKFH